MVWERPGVAERPVPRREVARGPAGRSSTVSAGGMALVLLAVPVVVLLSGEMVGRRWHGLRFDDPFVDRTAIAKVAEVVLTDVAKPALVVASLALVVWCLKRRSRRTAVIVGVTILVSNVTVQVVKHSPVDPGGALARLGPLSGHAALAGALCCGALLVVPLGRLFAAAAAVCTLLAAICLGVMAMGWHDPEEVLAPVLICLGWAMVAWPQLPRDRPSVNGSESPRAALRYPAAALVVLGAVLMAIGMVAGSSPGYPADLVDAGMDSAAVFVVGGSILTVGALVGMRAAWSQPAAPAAPARTGPNSPVTPKP
ncbi:MAG: hypothetical protein M3Y71_17660 [Actinomycetota bacterium]|nr:hypothetical protein [Actinomycetota bacterium]